MVVGRSSEDTGASVSRRQQESDALAWETAAVTFLPARGVHTKTPASQKCGGRLDETRSAAVSRAPMYSAPDPLRGSVQRSLVSALGFALQPLGAPAPSILCRRPT